MVEYSRHYNGQAVVPSNIITAIVVLVLAAICFSKVRTKKPPKL